MVAVASAARMSTGASTFASDNVRHLSRMELPGGGQIVIQGRYAYVGHQHRPDGTTIIDISDPRHPVVVSKLMTSHLWSHSLRSPPVFTQPFIAVGIAFRFDAFDNDSVWCFVQSRRC